MVLVLRQIADALIEAAISTDMSAYRQQSVDSEKHVYKN
jgi:hypothetical protein